MSLLLTCLCKLKVRCRLEGRPARTGINVPFRPTCVSKRFEATLPRDQSTGGEVKAAASIWRYFQTNWLAELREGAFVIGIPNLRLGLGKPRTHPPTSKAGITQE